MAPMEINRFAIMAKLPLHVREEVGGSTRRRAEQQRAKGEPLIPAKGSCGSPLSTGRHHHHRPLSPLSASPLRLLARSLSSILLARGASAAAWAIRTPTGPPPAPSSQGGQRLSTPTPARIQPPPSLALQMAALLRGGERSTAHHHTHTLPHWPASSAAGFACLFGLVGLFLSPMVMDWWRRAPRPPCLVPKEQRGLWG